MGDGEPFRSLNLDFDGGGVGGDLRSGDEDVVDAFFGDDFESDGGVDAAGVIPAGGGFEGVVDVDFNAIFSFEEMWGEFVGEGEVAVGEGAEGSAVEEDLGVHVDAIEVEMEFLIFGESGWGEGFAIPSDTAGVVAAFVFLGAVFGDAVLVGPIVGEVDGGPRAFVVLIKETEVP